MMGADSRQVDHEIKADGIPIDIGKASVDPAQQWNREQAIKPH